jgi:hypothetical protein
MMKGYEAKTADETVISILAESLLMFTSKE